jgi:hypothetical protein
MVTMFSSEIPPSTSASVYFIPNFIYIYMYVHMYMFTHIVGIHFKIMIKVQYNVVSRQNSNSILLSLSSIMMAA